MAQSGSPPPATGAPTPATGAPTPATGAATTASGGATPGSGGGPTPGRDWTTEAADRIEAVVTAVRDKTTVPVQKIATAVVYGLVAGLLGATAVILLLVGLFRLHVYLPFHPEGRRVWVSYAVLGAIFVVAGGFLWLKRTAQPKG